MVALANIEGVAIGQRFRCAMGPDQHVYERVEPMSYAEAFNSGYEGSTPAWVFMRCRRVRSDGTLGLFYLCRPDTVLEVLS